MYQLIVEEADDVDGEVARVERHLARVGLGVRGRMRVRIRVRARVRVRVGLRARVRVGVERHLQRLQACA